MLALSVLDQSPIPAGASAGDALANTIALAQLAERLGYRRYWVAEHHNTLALAGSAPEILVARLAAATSTLRVGAGGVMLTHYSPLKVAETFRVLGALFPGRIDLGLGRAPGGNSLAAAALRTGTPEPFPHQLQDVIGFLEDRLDPRHPFAGVRATPHPPEPPAVWLLGSSEFSAACAAALGTAYSYAHFISPEPGPSIVASYRGRFRPAPRLAEPLANLGVGVLCADTHAEALQLAASARLWRKRLQRGDPGPVPSVEEARKALGERAVQAPRDPLGRLVVGAPEQVRARLIELAQRYDVSELVVLTICHDPRARERSYELLAETFDLKRADAEVTAGA